MSPRFPNLCMVTWWWSERYQHIWTPPKDLVDHLNIWAEAQSTFLCLKKPVKNRSDLRCWTAWKKVMDIIMMKQTQTQTNKDLQERSPPCPIPPPTSPAHPSPSVSSVLSLESITIYGIEYIRFPKNLTNRHRHHLAWEVVSGKATTKNITSLKSAKRKHHKTCISNHCSHCISSLPKVSK